MRAMRSLRNYSDEEGRSFGVTMCDQYTSSIGHKIIKECHLDYVLLLDLISGKASLRSKTADVSEIAEKLGGGGHKLAAGFSYDFQGVYDVAAELIG